MVLWDFVISAHSHVLCYITIISLQISLNRWHQYKAMAGCWWQSWMKRLPPVGLMWKSPSLMCYKMAMMSSACLVNLTSSLALQKSHLTRITGSRSVQLIIMIESIAVHSQVHLVSGISRIICKFNTRKGHLHNSMLAAQILKVCIISQIQYQNQ